MTLKEILTGTSSWLRSHRYEAVGRCEPVLNEEGLLASHFDTDEGYLEGRSANGAGDPVMVQSVTSLERREPAEKLQEGFNKLVDQLQQINGHLNRQLEQHEELMGRVRELPGVLETLPAAVENQKQLTG